MSTSPTSAGADFLQAHPGPPLLRVVNSKGLVSSLLLLAALPGDAAPPDQQQQQHPPLLNRLRFVCTDEGYYRLLRHHHQQQHRRGRSAGVSAAAPLLLQSDGGCCSSCAQLGRDFARDVLSQMPVIVNRDGNKARRVLVETAPAAAAFRFYCGKPRSAAGLPALRCGPLGDNCDACQALDADFLERTLINRGGRQSVRIYVTSGHAAGTFRHYCGQASADYHCETCTSQRCGPFAGCNCSHCAALDEALPVKHEAWFCSSCQWRNGFRQRVCGMCGTAQPRRAATLSLASAATAPTPTASSAAEPQSSAAASASAAASGQQRRRRRGLAAGLRESLSRPRSLSTSSTASPASPTLTAAAASPGHSPGPTSPEPRPRTGSLVRALFGRRHQTRSASPGLSGDGAVPSRAAGAASPAPSFNLADFQLDGYSSDELDFGDDEASEGVRQQGISAEAAQTLGLSQSLPSALSVFPPGLSHGFDPSNMGAALSPFGAAAGGTHLIAAGGFVPQSDITELQVPSLPQSPLAVANIAAPGLPSEGATALALSGDFCESISGPEPKGDAEESPGATPTCVVCMDAPRNATIVHGQTGHQACCLPCAQTLYARGASCPICRCRIDLVVRLFSV